jgi:hypothetical protein
VIIAGNNTAIAAAQRATSTMPIVMVLAIDRFAKLRRESGATGPKHHCCSFVTRRKYAGPRLWGRRRRR